MAFFFSFIIKPTRCTIFTNLFRHESLHVSVGQFPCLSSAVHSLYTQQWYMSYRFVYSLRAGPGWNLKKRKNTYDNLTKHLSN